MYSVRFALIFILVHGALADIHYVTPGISVQEVVNSASVGDTLILEDGTHFSTVVLYGKDLAIGSEYLLSGDTTHIAATIVQPDAAHPDTASCFVYAYGESSAGRLVGLTLTGGRGTQQWNHNFEPMGGGVYIQSGETQGAGVTMEYCRIDSCRAVIGGGVWAAGYGDSASINMDHCTIRRCTGTDGGGGVFVVSASMFAIHCTFDSDSALGWVQVGLGAAILANGYSRILMDSCNVTACAGMTAAVGIYNFNTGVISNSRFENNWILYQFPAVATDLVIFSSSMTVVGCHFAQNYSGSWAVSIYGTVNHHSQFVGNLVENCVNCEGVIALSGRRGDFGYNVVRNNTGLIAGAMGTVLNGAVYSTVRIHHNVFAGNSSANPQTPSVLRPLDMLPIVDSNWVYGNNGPTMDIWRLYYSGILDARNNWWGHPSGPYHPTENPSGQGDTLLSDSVLFIPWLTEPPDTSMPDDYLSVRERPEISRTWELAALYPNPFNSSIRIVLAGFAGNDFEITLHNLLGQVVDVIHRGPLTGGQISYQAPPQLSSGVYFLRASDQKAIQSRKIILMK